MPLNADVFNNEPFGPVAAIRGFDTLDEAISEANRLPYGLAGYGFTSSIKTAHELGQRLAQLRAEVTAVRAMTYRIASRASTGAPGSEASLMRAFFSQLQQRIRRIALDVIGPDAIELPDDDPWIRPYLRSYSNTIAAGTSEIQRNIIGERVLGLPR